MLLYRMGFLRHIPGLIVALLFSALGALATPLAPNGPYQTKLSPHQEAAAFSAVSAGLTAEINPDDLGINLGEGASNPLLGFGEVGGNGLTLSNLLEGTLDSVVTSGLSSVVYDTDFSDSFSNALLSTIVNLVIADVQFEIGDWTEEFDWGEGSFEHAMLHGLAGCATAQAQGADCAAGAAGGIAQSLYAGQVENEPEPGTSEHQQWQMEQAALASMWGALGGYLFSGGEAANVSIASSIAQSGFINNYLSHTQWEEMVAELADCEGEEACKEAVYQKYETISLQQQEAFSQCIVAGDDCSAHIEAFAGVTENALAQAYDLSSEDLQNSEFLQSLISIQSQDARTLLSVQSGVYSAADAQNFYAQRCAGVSAHSCAQAYLTSAYAEQYAEALEAAGIVVDFVPVLGDLKAVYECGAELSPSACAGAVAGIIPAVGDAGSIVLRRGDEVFEVGADGTKVVDGATNTTGSAVDGIYGNTRPMTDEFPELAGVNPHYVDGAGPGVNTNCVSCVNATVDRLTGRNPDAVAGPSNGYGTPNDLLPSAPFGFRSPTNPANVTNELVAQGDGAVAVVRIQQAGPVEHVIVGVNRGGTVHYIDPQLGSIVDLQPNLTVIPGYR